MNIQEALDMRNAYIARYAGNGWSQKREVAAFAMQTFLRADVEELLQDERHLRSSQSKSANGSDANWQLAVVTAHLDFLVRTRKDVAQRLCGPTFGSNKPSGMLH